MAYGLFKESEIEVLRVDSSLRSFFNSTATTSSNSSAPSSPKFPVKINKKTPIKATRASTTIIKQRKRKLLILIGIVSLSFSVLWLPIHVINLWKVLFSDSFPYTDSMYIIKLIAHTLSYLNSSLNPFFYVLMGGKFKTHLSFAFKNLKSYFIKKSNKQIASKSNNPLTVLNENIDKRKRKSIENRNIRNQQFVPLI